MVLAQTKPLLLQTISVSCSRVIPAEPEDLMLNCAPSISKTVISSDLSSARILLKSRERSLDPLSEETPTIQVPVFETSGSFVISNVDRCVPVIFTWPLQCIISVAFRISVPSRGSCLFIY